MRVLRPVVVLFTFVFLLFSFILPNASYSNPWPMFGHDAQQTSKSEFVGPETPTLRWQYHANSQIIGSPSVGSDGTVFFESSDGWANAVDSRGILKWRHKGGSRRTPALSLMGEVYTSSIQDTFYHYIAALSLGGSLQWRYNLWGSGFQASPIVDSDGTIYIISNNTAQNIYLLYALNPDGTLKWQYNVFSKANSSPTVDKNGTVYVHRDPISSSSLSANGGLIAISAQGEYLWFYKTDGGSSPAIGGDGTIYVGSYDNYLYAINPDGTIKWRYQTGGSIYSSPAIGGDGTIYVGSYDNYLYAINPDGTIKWRYQTGGRIYSSPAIGGDGTIYFGSYDNYLYAINPDGTIKWRYQTGGSIYSSPAIGGDGTIYIGSLDGFLYAINPKQLSGIAGKVYGYAFDDAISFVSIKTSGGVLSSCSSEGEYFLQLPSGVHNLTFSLDNFQTITVNNILVNEGQITKLDAYLPTPGLLNFNSISPLLPANTGVEYNERVLIVGGTFPYAFSVPFGQLPPGLVIDSASGNISGMPTQVGSYTFSIGVEDSAGTYAEREFTIEVTQPLDIFSINALPRGTKFQPYLTSLKTIGGTPPYTYTYDGLTKYEISQSGADWSTARNTCQVGGGHLVTIHSESENDVVKRLISSNQNNVWVWIGLSGWSEGAWQWVSGEPLTYTNWIPAHSSYGCVGIANSGVWAVNLCNYNLKYICEYKEESIAGIVSTVEGSIEGVPTEVGSQQLTAYVMDSSGRTASKVFYLSVDQSLEISSTKLNNGIVGSAYNQSLAATGGYGNYSWAVYAGRLPDGITLNSSGELTGTPTQATNGTIVLAVRDEYGRTQYQDFNFLVVDPLTFVTSSLPTGLVGSGYSELIVTNGGVGPYSYSYSGQLPAGLTLNPSTGIISGIPTTGGFVNLGITVTDSTWPTSQSINQFMGIRTTSLLTVTTSAVLPTIKQGETMSPLTLSAGGGPSPHTWQVVGGYLPTGVTLDSVTGTLSGTPAAGGDYVFTLQVTDSTGTTAEKEFFFTVYRDLEISTSVVPAGGVGEPYYAILEAKGGKAPYSWRLVSGTLPSGLSLNSEGRITGTPTARQSYQFTVEVSDADSPAQAVQKTFAIETYDDLYIITNKLQDGRINEAYTATIQAGLGVPPYSFSISQGVLPPGLFLDSTNESATISGIPTTPGEYTFTVEVFDTGTPRATDSVSYTITIYDGLTITTPALTSAFRGEYYSDTIHVTGGALPYTWDIISGELPAGLSLNRATGAITGITQLVAGQSSTFTIRVREGAEPYGAVEKTFAIYVITPMTIDTPSVPNGMQWSAYSATFSGTGGISPYTWSIGSGNLPPGLTIGTSTGTIAGTITECGPYDFTVNLADSIPAPNTTTTNRAYQVDVDCQDRNRGMPWLLLLLED